MSDKRKHTTVKDMPEFEPFQAALEGIKLSEEATLLVDSGELSEWVADNVAPYFEAKEQLARLGHSTGTLHAALALSDCVSTAFNALSGVIVHKFAEAGLVIQEVQQPMLTVARKEA